MRILLILIKFSSGEIIKDAPEMQYFSQGNEENYDSVQKLKVDIKVAQKTIELLGQENEALRRELDEHKLTMYIMHQSMMIIKTILLT